MYNKGIEKRKIMKQLERFKGEKEKYAERKESLEKLRSRIEKKKKEKREINDLDFCSCLLGYLKLNNCIEFDIYALASFVWEKFQEDEEMRILFANIDSSLVIDEGISDLEIHGCIKRNIFSTHPRVRILLDREEAYNFTKCVREEERIAIENLALDFLFPNKKNLDPKYILKKKEGNHEFNRTN